MVRPKVTLRIDGELNNALKGICKGPYNQTYVIDQALRAYKPIKQYLAKHDGEGDLFGDKPKVANVRFVKPNADELAEYFKYLGLSNVYDQADRFLNHYESNGWMVGKNKMKSWKSACKNWKMRRKGYENSNRNSQQGSGQEQRLSAAERVERAMSAQCSRDQDDQAAVANTNGDLYEHVP